MYDNLEQYPMAATLNHAIAARIAVLDQHFSSKRRWGLGSYSPMAYARFQKYVWDKYGFAVTTILYHFHPDPRKCNVHMLVKNGYRASLPK